MSYSSPHINTMFAAARQAGKKLVRDFGEVEICKYPLKGCQILFQLLIFNLKKS